jgi:hypothetical protein
MHYLTFDKFYSQAAKLRAEFDANFADPLKAHAGRFVWDYWHVPGEYTHLRTPAYTYFSAKLYTAFHRNLVRFGRERLGCHDISPPWLSCYVEGCRQEPHEDRPHGPLAFVYSLTPARRKFRGGETFIKKPKTLIAPDFNRLTLFNPSLTHGVREVRGTHDPRDGRLVIHGWFVNPRPFWVGPLTVAQVRRALDRGLAQMPLENLGDGFGAFRLKIGRDGRVKSASTLVETFKHSARVKDLRLYWNEFDFGKLRAPATLTLPLRID